MELVPAINLLLIVFILVFLIVKSNSWTTPVLDKRLSKVEDTVKILLGNVKRIEYDSRIRKEEADKINDEILRDLRANNEIIRDIIALRQEFKTLEDTVTEQEQKVSALPCFTCLDEKEKVIK